MNEYFVYPRQGLKSFTVSSIWKFFKVASYGVKSVEIFGYFETQYPKTFFTEPSPSYVYYQGWCPVHQNMPDLDLYFPFRFNIKFRFKINSELMSHLKKKALEMI